MQPFFQGQLDCFCAAYAVLNALRRLHSLSVSAARGLFNEMIVDLAANQEEFAAVAFNASDHAFWVARLLRAQEGSSRAVRWLRPFPAKGPSPASPKRAKPALDSGRYLITRSPGVTPAMLWQGLENWFAGAALHRPRTAILRFHRYLPMAEHPAVSHWSTLDQMRGDSLHLMDASMEPTAVHTIDLGNLVTDQADIGPARLIHIEPSTLFLLERL